MTITDKYVEALGKIAELKQKNDRLKIRHKHFVSGENAKLLGTIRKLEKELKAQKGEIDKLLNIKSFFDVKKKSKPNDT